jgi:uncharacterized membrane-anchored protein YitT (DUF2179 family)
MTIVFLLNICVLIGTTKDIEEKTFTKFILNVLFISMKNVVMLHLLSTEEEMCLQKVLELVRRG